MTYKLLAYLIACATLTIILYKINLNYSYSDFKDYLNVLLGISSMVFSLMGIWIAFLYPNALRRIADPKRFEYADFSETMSETRRLEGLVGAVMKSAVVVLAVMVLFLCKVIFSGFSFSEATTLKAKAPVLSFVLTLSVLQAESIFYVIYSNVMFINDLHNKREDREADNDI